MQNPEITNVSDAIPQKQKITISHYDYYDLIKHVAQQGRDLFGGGFVIDDLDRPVITKLLTYFMRDEDVAPAVGLDLNKGLLLTGPIGCGKTSLIRIMRNLAMPAYKPVIRSCREICFDYGRFGFDVIQRYSTRSFEPYTSIPRTYCFDDLGMESLINYWGNNFNVMAEILQSRYDLMINCRMVTYATTNKNAEELEAAYGPQVRSRMRSMFNLVAFHPESRDKRV